MDMSKLQAPARKHAIDFTNRETNGYVKTKGACTEAGYRQAGTKMAILKIQAPALMLAFNQQAENIVMLKLQAHALQQAIDQQTDTQLC